MSEESLVGSLSRLCISPVGLMGLEDQSESTSLGQGSDLGLEVSAELRVDSTRLSQ